MRFSYLVFLLSLVLVIIGGKTGNDECLAGSFLAFCTGYILIPTKPSFYARETLFFVRWYKFCAKRGYLKF